RGERWASPDIRVELRCPREARARSLQDRVDPAEQAHPDLVAVRLVQHLVPSPGVEIVDDVVAAPALVAQDQELHAFELLAPRGLAAREEGDGQVVSDPGG